MGRVPSADNDEVVRVYRFADVVVDAAAHTLLRAGTPQQIEPKAFAVLLALLRHPGELLPRDALIDEVWGHSHVTPGVLTRVIAQLRHALGDDPHHPRVIQTQHALGYRFIAELLPEPVEAPALPGNGADDGTTHVEPYLGPERRSSDALAANGDPVPTAREEPADGAAVPEHDGDAGTAEPAGPAPARAAMPDTAVRPSAAPAKAHGAWRGWILPALLVLAVVLAAVLVERWSRTPPKPAASAASIAVMPFTSLSADRDDAYFAEGLAVEMHDALAGVRGLKVAAQSSSALAGPGSVDVRKAGAALGVATVLDATVRRDGRRVRVSARLSDVATGFTLWSETYDRELSDVFTVQTQVASEVVRELLGVLPRDEAALQARLAPTRNVAAFDAYLRGLHALQSRGGDDGPERSIGFFNQALAADSSFARAQAGICRAQIRRLETVRDGAAFARAQQACQRAASMDPDLHEVSVALGEMYRVQGDLAMAMAKYTKALAAPALRADAYVGLARVAEAGGRNPLALEYYRRAIELRPGDGAVYRQLGYHHYLAGNLAEAIAAYTTAATLQPDDSEVWSGLGGLRLASGDRAGAAEAFKRSLAIRPNYGALSNLGTLRFETGDYAAAATLFRRATQVMPDDYRPWANLGDALLADPATANQAREPHARAAELAGRYVAVTRDDAQARAQLAWFSANAGDAAATRRWIAEAEAIGSERGEVALLAAQALAVIGDPGAARAQVAAARKAGIPEQRIATMPALRPLLKDEGAATGDTTAPVNGRTAGRT